MDVSVTSGQYTILEHLSIVEDCLFLGKKPNKVGLDINEESLKRYYDVTIRSKWDNKDVSLLLSRFKEGTLKVK